MNNPKFAQQMKFDFLRSQNLGDQKNIKNSNITLKNEIISGSNHLNLVHKRQRSMMNNYENDLTVASTANTEHRDNIVHF
jgi:hypothetical protein